MAESIIKKYFYYEDLEELKEIKAICLFRVLTRMKNFQLEKGKAYSYIQTLIKNQCNDYFRLKAQRAKRITYIDYEAIIELTDQHESYTIDEDGDHDYYVSEIIGFLNHVSTGTTSISPILISEIGRLIESPSERQKLGIKDFYKKKFGTLSNGRKESKQLQLEFKEWIEKRNQN